MLAKLCIDADWERKEKQCAARQAWPLRPLETEDNQHKVHISSITKYIYIYTSKISYVQLCCVIKVNNKSKYKLSIS